jgi:hypothetical protein
VAVVLAITFSVVYFGDNYADAPVFKSPLFTLFGWFGSIAFLGMGAKYLDFSNEFTTVMNKYSWGLYVFHYLGISIIAVCIAQKGVLPFLIVYLLSLISAFVIAYLLYELISRLPFFRWVVLGIKK